MIKNKKAVSQTVLWAIIALIMLVIMLIYGGQIAEKILSLID